MAGRSTRGARVEPETAGKTPVQGDSTEKRWTLGRWGDRTQWNCTACRWDTIDGEDAMIAHFRGMHAGNEPSATHATRPVYLYDSSGELRQISEL